jgi:hypothetical protein
LGPRGPVIRGPPPPGWSDAHPGGGAPEEYNPQC